MKTAKKVAALALMLGLALAAQPVKALVSDQITITITPSVALNVAIDTTTINWSNGDSGLTLTTSMDLGATVYMTSPATMTYTGSFTDAEMDVTGSDAGMNWTFDANQGATGDQLQAYLLFTDVSRSSAPTSAEFEDNADHLIQNSAVRLGASGGDNADGNFLNSAASSNDENFVDNEQAHMWFRLDLPPTSSFTGDEVFTLTLTAVSLD